MKILFVTPALTIGGIEVLALRLSEAFGKAAHQVILYDFMPEKQNAGLIANYDTRFFRLEYSGKEKPLWNKLLWKVNAVLYKTGLKKNFMQKSKEMHFARMLKKERPDIICSLSFHQDYLACQYAGPSGIPVVISMHGVYEYTSPEWPEKARFIYEHVKAIIYAADKNMSWYRIQPYFNNRIPAVKIYTGTNLKEPIPKSTTRADLGLSESDFIFIMVARGIKEKGWLEVISVFKKVRAAYQDTALLLVGDGSYLEDLKIQFSAEPGIVFYGTHPNSIEITALADVGLLPTYFPIETMPNVIIDYLRCSLPVIASDIAEIPQMLTLPGGEEAGYILKLLSPGTGVSEEELYLAMKQLVSDPATYKRKVQLAKEAAQKFDLHKCVNSYLEVFNKAIST